MIKILPAFGDNYIYQVEYAPGACFVVDPGDSGVVSDAMKQSALELTHILITHHHADHIGGVGKLKSQTGAKVIGPDKRRIASLDTVVAGGELIEIGELQIQVIATPGHTATSVCYVVTGGQLHHPVAFTGDTMFVCGCGRMFECDGQTMYASLCKLKELPDETAIYPGHDYTQENVAFALTFEPEHPGLQDKLAQIRGLAAKGLPTVPSTIGEEKVLSCFLRPNSEAIRQKLQMENAADWEVFAELRRRKDVF